MFKMWSPRVLKLMALLVPLMVAWSLTAEAQTQAEDKASAAPSAGQSIEFAPYPVHLKSLPQNLFQDQKNFWLTPFHMTKREWQWTVPLAFAGAVLLGSDTAIEKH